MKKMKENYNHTIYASYIGYITQAVINNYAPLLFLTFQSSFKMSLDEIAVLVTLNFGIQLLVDLCSAAFVDKIGYRISIVTAHIFSAAGLIGLYIFPSLISDAYAGIMIAVVCYAIGGGLIEVLISPIVEACPTGKKEAAMSLLHSFYCWGQVFVVLVSTIFFTLFGIENWGILACIWAVVPLANCVYFCKVPIRVLVEEGKEITVFQLLKEKMFWVLCLLMICAGASEQGMSQWASAFAESGLGVSKTIGDLAGPCAFAFFMGCSRMFYGKYSEKVNLQKFMFASSALCIISYLLAALSLNPVMGLIGCSLCGLSVGIMWPGSFSIASGILKRGGTALFAFLALAGDLGCSLGPAVVGMVSEEMGDDLQKGLLAAVIFPILLIMGLVLSVRYKNSTDRNESKSNECI